MKVLTLHQPWASLVALGVKTIETRSWSTRYRGPLTIHAGARMPFPVHPRGVKWRGGRWAMWHANVSGPGWTLQPEPDCNGGVFPLPLGAIVATCVLVDVVPIINRDVENEAATPPSDREVWVSGDDPLVLAEWDHGWTETAYLGDQLPYGDFTAGRYAWLLADIVPVDPPVPFRGGQGLTKTWEPVAAAS